MRQATVYRTLAEIFPRRLMNRQVPIITSLCVVFGTAMLFALPFAGKPWGWSPSFGGSYGETIRGLCWVREMKLQAGDIVQNGDNITYSWSGRGVVKRVWKVSTDSKWVWVGGDNTSDGASSGSCEVGWIALPGAKSNPPTFPKANPSTKPITPIVANGVVNDLWAPFDRRSAFEKRVRFFNQPEDVLAQGSWLVVSGENQSNVYDRRTGMLQWSIPGRASQFDGPSEVFYLAKTAFPLDPIMSKFNLRNGQAKVSEPRPKINAPINGEIDLRNAKIIESAGQNPAKVFDGDTKTAWTIGADNRQQETLSVIFSGEVFIDHISIDARLAFGTSLEVYTGYRKHIKRVNSLSRLDQRVDRIEFVLIQKSHMPVTGQVKEVRIYG